MVEKYESSTNQGDTPSLYFHESAVSFQVQI